MSAVVKISRVTKLPENRKVYRGLGGVVLGDEWFTPDSRNVRSGVELGFLSTTVRNPLPNFQILSSFNYLERPIYDTLTK